MKTYKFIKKWSDFILNETLKTNNIDFVINNLFDELSLSDINCTLNKNDNKIELHILNFKNLYINDTFFNYINSLFIDRNGWFPSKMKINKIDSKINTIKYDENFLINNKDIIECVIITYEPKFDIVVNNPDKLYHLSIKQYKNSILQNGLITKTKSKKTIHLDRIYLCSKPEDCYLLIYDMKYDYQKQKNKNNKNNINIDWIIYEIDFSKLKDIKLYKDPNYKDKGYYIIENIKPEFIKIYKEENDD